MTTPKNRHCVPHAPLPQWEARPHFVSQADVAMLAGEAPSAAALRPYDAEEVARKIGRAFSHAVFVDQATAFSAPNEMRDWFASVARHARSLLDLLGVEASGEQASQMSPAASSHMESVLHLLFDGERIDPWAVALAQRIASGPAATLTVNDYGQIRQAVQLSPAGIGLLEIVAQGGVTQFTRLLGKGPVGRPFAKGRRELLRKLAEIHNFMFGVFPQIHRPGERDTFGKKKKDGTDKEADGRDRDGLGGVWLDKVLTLALDNGPPSVSAFAERLSALDPDSMREFFRQGIVAAKKLGVEKAKRATKGE